MLEFKEALKLITSHAETLGTETVPLEAAHKRVLAKDTFYDLNLPPFNKSAMDGYACRIEDINEELEVLECVYAGKKPENTIGKNQCAKIMTGAVVPEGADCVMMREYVEELPNGKVKSTTGKTKANICYTAEDIKTGDLALAKNTFLESKHLPILAGAGISTPEVYVQPRVSVFATGSELVEPDNRPLSFQIRNSNSSQMVAQVSELGLKAKYQGIIVDNYEETKSRISAALEESDVVMMSGGVSVGDFDFIPTVIEDLGFEILLTRSAIQPGKPIIFAKKGNQYCIGLAGNPASSYIQFNLYIRPFLYALSGYEFKTSIREALITEDYARRKSDRMLFVPSVENGDGTVTPADYHGSAHINALIEANCLLMIPIGVKELKKGETVNVRSL